MTGATADPSPGGGLPAAGADYGASRGSGLAGPAAAGETGRRVGAPRDDATDRPAPRNPPQVIDSQTCCRPDERGGAVHGRGHAAVNPLQRPVTAATLPGRRALTTAPRPYVVRSRP